MLNILLGRQRWQLDSKAVLAVQSRAARASEQLHITCRGCTPAEQQARNQRARNTAHGGMCSRVGINTPQVSGRDFRAVPGWAGRGVTSFLCTRPVSTCATCLLLNSCVQLSIRSVEDAHSPGRAVRYT